MSRKLCTPERCKKYGAVYKNGRLVKRSCYHESGCIIGFIYDVIHILKVKNHD
jgi:hypothetical protein